MKKIIMLSIVIMICALSMGTVAKSTETKTFSLIKQKNSDFDYVGLAPDQVLSRYKTVFIDKVTVTFEQRWVRDHRHDVDKHYMERVSKEYAAMLKEALTKAFAKNEHILVVDQPTPDTLIVHPNLADVRINGPDGSQLTHHLVHFAGDAQLLVHFYHNNQLVASIGDYRQTTDRALFGPVPTNRALNYRDFSLLMSRWSKDLVKTFW